MSVSLLLLSGLNRQLILSVAHLVWSAPGPLADGQQCEAVCWMFVMALFVIALFVMALFVMALFIMALFVIALIVIALFVMALFVIVRRHNGDRQVKYWHKHNKTEVTKQH